MLFGLCSPAEAQQAKKVPRIGYVSGIGDSANPGPNVEAFRQGLRDLGYNEGKNIHVEYRYIEGQQDKVPSLVADLVGLKVDVLILVTLPAIRAAKEATKTIPIVMVTTQDPIAVGLIDSLARPGGNITGITRLTRELSGKRLELVKEVLPTISRVGILWSTNSSVAVAFKEYETSARTLKIPLRSLEVGGPNPDLEGAFQTAARERINALITIMDTVLNRYTTQIAELAIKNRLPSMCEVTSWVAEGCLLSYAANDPESYKRVAVYVDKLLKGAKPADLPVEQPTKFEFVINLKTAKQIGLTIPQSVLYRADKVIK
jgi:putative tryptophan/tyrosine transport system substrate-binding protein